jgi:hypothetical protein
MCKQRAIKSAGPENRDPLLILDDFITRDGVPNGAPSPSLRQLFQQEATLLHVLRIQSNEYVEFARF